MNDPHPHDHDHDHGPVRPEPAADSPVDAGSQALADALRSSFRIIQFVMVLLVIYILGSGLFKVEPNQQAIILHFGKPVGEGAGVLLGPGLHWSYPSPIDEHQIVSVTSLQKVTSTVGWYATTPEMEAAGLKPSPGASLNPAIDGYVLTADANIVHVRATVYYHIDDPKRFIFGFVNASNAVLNALNNAVLYAAAQYKVDDILTRDIAGFRDLVTKRAADLVEKENIGVAVEHCEVDHEAPLRLKDAFDNVVKAKIARDRVLNEAWSYTNQVLHQADGEATVRINLAQSDRARLTNGLASEAASFAAVLPKYQANPELFVQQRLNETLGSALTNLQDKIFLPEQANGKERELRLLLNRELPKAAGQTNQ
jgi:membrane protease subunit HflK